MPDTPETVTDPALRARLTAIQQRLAQGLRSVDPHRRLVGRPVTARIIAGQTVEIVYSEVPGIDEAEVLGVKRLIGAPCYCTVQPETAETLRVRFVISLTEAVARGE